MVLFVRNAAVFYGMKFRNIRIILPQADGARTDRSRAERSGVLVDIGLDDIHTKDIGKHLHPEQALTAAAAEQEFIGKMYMSAEMIERHPKVQGDPFHSGADQVVS